VGQVDLSQESDTLAVRLPGVAGHSTLVFHAPFLGKFVRSAANIIVQGNTRVHFHNYTLLELCLEGHIVWLKDTYRQRERERRGPTQEEEQHARRERENDWSLPERKKGDWRNTATVKTATNLTFNIYSLPGFRLNRASRTKP
jgi:hypothetical protein